MKDKNRFAWGSNDISVTEDAKKSVSILKTDDDKRLVFGWASVSITVDGEQLEDRQKDMIDPEDLEEAAYEYVLNFRDTGEEHISSMRKKGKLVESVVFTEEKQKAMGIPPGTLPVAWWIGFKIEDDAAWERVKNGTYKMFSIEGKANRIPVEKSSRDYDEYPEYGMWLEENLDATIEEQRAAERYYEDHKKKPITKGRLKGCGVLVVRNGKILSGTRIERNSRGQICGPGGHIEAGEAPEEAAKREAWEEFGITCEELTPMGTLKDGTSAIFLCTKFSGTPKTDEEEMTDLKWRTIEELREENLFGPFEASLEKLPPSKRHGAAKTFNEVLKFNPNHDAKGRFAPATGGGGAATSAGMKAYIDGLNPDVEYPERVEHWKKQIQAGNDRPILVSATDENRVIDGNHTLAAYKELGKTPKVYAMDRVEFLLGASEAKDTVDFIRQAIKDGKATEVKKDDREILKANPHHDALGRFTTEGAAGSGAAGTAKKDIDKLAAKTAKNMSAYEDNNFAKQLTNAEGEAAAAYTEEIGFEMNKMARGKAIDEEHYDYDEVLDHALNLETALSKAKLPQDAAVFRGASFDTAVDSTGLSKKEIQADPQKLVGKTITELGFMSTSTDAGLAEEYADGMVYHIKLPAGSQAVLQNSLNPYLDGPEITVNRNSKFRVLDAENKGGNTHVYMEYLRTGNSAPVAKSFEEVLKLNPFHDARGRFATKNGFKTYSANPNTRAGAMAIARSAAAGHGATMNVHPESYGETISQNADWLGNNNYNVGPGQTGNGILTQEVEPKNGMAGASAHGYVWQYYNRLDNRTTSQTQAKQSALADHVKNVRLKDSDKLAMSPRDPYSKVVQAKIIAKNHDQARVAGKDISDSVDLSTSKSKKAAIDKMAKLQGWNKAPTVTEDLEVFQKAVKQSGQLLVRTVHVDYATGKSAIDICKDTMGKGNAALGGGGGKAYGGGMYMVGTHVTGATGRKLREKVAFAQNDSYGYGDTQMMATVHPSAKIATPNHTYQMKDDFLKMPSSKQAKYGNDYGAYIASKGFDGAQWHEGDNSYITMYNKSAMIFYAGVVAN